MTTNFVAANLLLGFHKPLVIDRQPRALWLKERGTNIWVQEHLVDLTWHSQIWMSAGDPRCVWRMDPQQRGKIMGWIKHCRYHMKPSGNGHKHDPYKKKKTSRARQIVCCIRPARHLLPQIFTLQTYGLKLTSCQISSNLHETLSNCG